MSESSLSRIEKKVIETLRNVLASGYGSVNIAVKDKQVVDLVPSFKTDLEELKELQRAR